MAPRAKIAALVAEPAFASLRALARGLLRRSRARCGDGSRSTPASCAPATSPSTSAPMSATARAASAASAPACVALEPQPLCARAIRAIYAADEQVDAGRGGLRGASGQGHAQGQLRQPDGLDGLGRVRGCRRRRRRLGGPGLGQGDRGAVHDARCADCRASACPPSPRSMWKASRQPCSAGLTQPLPALSFEFTTIQRDVALACLDRLASLGTYAFDVALGESQTLTFNRWISQSRHGLPPRRPAARRQLRGRLLCAPELTRRP